jgi:hypothetical protein
MLTKPLMLNHLSTQQAGIDAMIHGDRSQRYTGSMATLD